MCKNTLLSLWLLLATALAVVLWVAFSDDLKIWNYTVKKAPVADLFTSGSADMDLVAVDSIAVAENAKPLSVAVDTVKQSIFIFGDSMTFNLALRLAQYAKQNGHTINSVNWDSSNTKIWADHDTLAYYIDKFKPTQVFISLGSNELYISKPESRLPYIHKILEVIDTIPYVWIGPPNWKEDMGINDLLQRTCKPGSFFRTAGMQFERKKDHVHPTRAASALWVDSIMRWLPKSAHPFVAEMPSDSIGKANPNIVFLKALNK